jgi:hypothetical protein
MDEPGGTVSGANEVRWARRVKPEKIRRLYLLDARGIRDEALIDDVGYAILARCEAIRAVTDAHYGMVRCPRCRSGIRREDLQLRDAPIVCGCGWETTWREYHLTCRRKQLVGGAALPSFSQFVQEWPSARTPADKILLIDRVIHAVHNEAQSGFGRPAACNLIEGGAAHLVELLDALAYGDGSTPTLAERADDWRAGNPLFWSRIRKRDRAP